MRSRRLLGALLIAVSLRALACGPAAAPAPDADWPAGALLSADRTQLVQLLSQLAQLEGTPLARLAGELRATLPDCEALEATSAAAAGLGDALRCAETAGALAGLHAHRGDAGLALAVPLDAAPRLLVRVEARETGLRVELRWPEAAAGELARLLPGSDAAGPDVLSADARVLHARVRSQRLDLESLVPAGSQGDQLFRLRSGLLSKALLDDTWELALYPPTGRSDMPRMALALGVRIGAAAERAVDRFVGELEASWSLRRAPLPEAFAQDRARGTCLPGLRIMPEFAPCVLTTDRAVVIGYNAASLYQAVHGARSDGPPGELASPPEAARVALDLERLQQADLQLAAADGHEALGRVTRWPWQRALARGGRRGDAIELLIELVHDAGLRAVSGAAQQTQAAGS